MKNQKKFKVINLIAPEELYLPKLGLTLDEKQDFKLIKENIENLRKKK